MRGGGGGPRAPGPYDIVDCNHERNEAIAIDIALCDDSQGKTSGGGRRSTSDMRDKFWLNQA